MSQVVDFNRQRWDVSGYMRSCLALVLAGGGIALFLVAASRTAEPATPAASQTAHAEHAADLHAGTSHAVGDAHASGHETGHGEYTLWADLPFWSAIAFVGFVYAIKRLGLWDHLLSNMSRREQAETEAIVLAEADLGEARAMLRQSQGRMEALDESIREILAEAERDVNYTRSEIQRQGEKESAGFLSRVEQEVGRARDQSLHDLFSSLSDKITMLTEQRLTQGLNPDDQYRLIDTTLNELSIRS
jgi:F0F1-type ATP synthase membrane subunit b/b'